MHILNQGSRTAHRENFDPFVPVDILQLDCLLVQSLGVHGGNAGQIVDHNEIQYTDAVQGPQEGDSQVR
eukprot:2260325-Pyramimonas_sp.AAC.1